MPLVLIRNDITQMHVDAIVNTSNKYLRAGSGVNGAIHKAAGPLLQVECDRLNGCEVGEVKVTDAYQLPCKYVFHTVTPVWIDGKNNEAELLSQCYRSSLHQAMQKNCESIAFPLMASGAHGFPNDLALSIATGTISRYLLEEMPDHDLTVYLVMFTKKSFMVGSKLYHDIKQYIDDRYVDEHYDIRRESQRSMRALKRLEDEMPIEACMPMAIEDAWAPDTIEEALNMIDESFSQMVLRKIAEKDMKNSECYKRANIDKKLFSKIVNNSHYKPKKTTALALAVALELSLDETKELLMKAGLALSHSDKFDIIVEFFIMHGKYDIFEINEMLYDFDQALLGGALL